MTRLLLQENRGAYRRCLYASALGAMKTRKDADIIHSYILWGGNRDINQRRGLSFGEKSRGGMSKP